MTTTANPAMAGARQWRGVIEEYRDRLPVTTSTPVVTLREGGTPLVPARVLSERTGCEVHLKVEGANPTGSFKDRGMTVAISKAREAGAQAVICASTGNTSASAAAYAVRAGMVCAVLVPQGKIALGKMGQALVKAAAFIHDHPKETTEMLGKRVRITDQKILDGMYKVTVESTPLAPVLDAKGLETADQLNVEAGFLPASDKLKSYDNIFTNEYVQAK